MEIAHKNPGPESFLFSLPAKDIDAPPLTVPCTTRSHWLKGSYYGREHSDTFWIEAVVAGNMLFTQNGQTCRIEPRQFFLPHKGGTHMFKTGPAGYVLKRGLMIDGSMLESVLLHTGLDKTDHIKPRSRQEFLKIIGWFKACDALLRAKEAGFMYDLGMLACRILMELGVQNKRFYPQAVERALDFIHKSSAGNISDRDIAQAACISIPHLHRLFKQHINATPCAYVSRMKMEQAKHLLKLTTTPVRDIGMRFGYDDQAYFSAAFRHAVGVSPMKYRMQGG
jgi:AraC-like DNA-binding protein